MPLASPRAAASARKASTRALRPRSLARSHHQRKCALRRPLDAGIDLDVCQFIIASDPRTWECREDAALTFLMGMGSGTINSSVHEAIKPEITNYRVN